MKIEKIGDMLAVVIPADVATALGLSEGDMVDIQPAKTGRLSDDELARLHAKMTALARPLPEGYRFDREEANARA